jgi:hypothetical protein
MASVQNEGRLRQQITELQEQWELLSQKLSRLEKDKILETHSDEKFRMEHLIAQIKTERAQIEQQLIDLEAQLSRYIKIGAGDAVDRNEDQTPITKPSTLSLVPNPFGDKGRITNPHQFFDRAELLRQIFEELNKGVNISLVSESAIGKSSLLAMVCEQGTDRTALEVFENLKGLRFVYFNLEWIENEDDFYDALCDELEIEACRGYKLTRALKGKRYVLCLDEIEKMAWDSFTVKVRSHLRGLADGPAAPLKLVIASRSPLARLFPDSPELDSPLAGICRQIDVKPFAPAVAREFLLRRLEGSSITFTEDQTNELITKSGGHPAKLQDEAAKLYRELMRNT